MEEKKELTGCQHLAMALTADLRRKRIDKLTKLAQSRKRNSKDKK